MPRALRILYWITLACAAIAGGSAIAALAGHAFYPVLFCLPMLFIIWPIVIWRWRRVPRQNFVSQIFGDVPLWMKIMTGLLLAYAFGAFFVGVFVMNGGGHPIVQPDGALTLASRSKILAVLTEQEFRRAEAVEVHVISSNLLVFFSIAALALRTCWIKTGTAMADSKL